MNWRDLVPEEVAVQQQAWERKAQASRMRFLGFTYKDIGKRFGVSACRAHQLVKSMARRKVSPVEIYMKQSEADPKALGRALGGRPRRNPLVRHNPIVESRRQETPSIDHLKKALQAAEKQAAHWEKEARFWYQRADELLKQQRRQ